MTDTELCRIEARRREWAEDPRFDPATRAEAAALTDEKEIRERFCAELDFGTGGLRGIMGAGTNRFNLYTVRKATGGLARYLRRTGKKDTPCVVLAYDSRNHSAEYAKDSALVLCGAGIRAYLFPRVSATPLLSFAVRELHADAGVVLTASHNPKEYNGYKVYGADGCQAVPEIADGIIRDIRGIATFTETLPMNEADARAKGLLLDVPEEVPEAFIRAATAFGNTDAEKRKHCRIVYTPLHGAGREPVTAALTALGYSLTVVPEQEKPDGNFPTVVSPNPENREALTLAIALAEKTGADLVLGTDPDSDRLGVGVKHHGEYRLLTGNQIGALLVDDLVTRGEKKTHPVLVKTVVTNDLGAEIARKSGAEIRETLTGFKYIGEQIGRMERDGSGEFFFGYEESYGFLAGTHARDKDAVSTAVLVAEMAAYHLAAGRTLIDVLEDIYARYGYYLDALDSFTFPGLDGKEKIDRLMALFRERGGELLPGVSGLVDYRDGAEGLPPSDVLKFRFAEGSWLALRPSGTEPKIKFYYSVRAKTASDANARLDVFRAIVRDACAKI